MSNLSVGDRRHDASLWLYRNCGRHPRDVSQSMGLRLSEEELRDLQRGVSPERLKIQAVKSMGTPETRMQRLYGAAVACWPSRQYCLHVVALPREEILRTLAKRYG